MREITENTADQIPFPDNEAGVDLRPSEIEGTGLFAVNGFGAGQLIAPGRRNKKRTPAGRYTNHSPFPCAVAEAWDNGEIWLRARTEILAGQEITVDYRQAAQQAGRADCYLLLAGHEIQVDHRQALEQIALATHCLEQKDPEHKDCK